jgi:hypothetical protein
MTTATPLGRIASSTARATCLVNRSWTCNRLEKVSAILANFERPRTNLLGIYPMEICHQLGSAEGYSELTFPVNGTM